MCDALGICAVSESSTGSFGSTSRRLSSLSCVSSEAVATSASGCAYCVGCVAIGIEIQSAAVHRQANLLMLRRALPYFGESEAADRSVAMPGLLLRVHVQLCEEERILVRKLFDSLAQRSADSVPGA